LNPSVILRILLVAAGGSLGSVLRYSFSGLGSRWGNGIFPWGTMLVNLAGSFLIGIAWGLLGREDVPPQTRLFLFIGIFGGFTTFSTFTFESFNLIKDGNIKLAVANMLLSNIGGIICVFAGIFASGILLQLKK
jgi:fluoride exporter